VFSSVDDRIETKNPFSASTLLLRVGDLLPTASKTMSQVWLHP
jgi:hypothetical protein